MLTPLAGAGRLPGSHGRDAPVAGRLRRRDDEGVDAPGDRAKETRPPPSVGERCTVAALRSEAPDVDTVTRVGRLADERDRAFFAQLASRAAQPAPADR
jgi:hypothetical protein